MLMTDAAGVFVLIADPQEAQWLNGSLFDLSGRVAVVTGGNRGIGRAMALGLAHAGASVFVLARNAEHNESVLAELEAIGSPARVRPSMSRIGLHWPPRWPKWKDSLGGVDILVNNAGIVTLTGGVLNETADIWDRTIETHLNASFLLSQLVAKSMVKRKSGGKIINLASMYSILVLGSCPPTAPPRELSCSSPVSRDRTGATQHPGQCHRARLDRNRHDGCST